MVIDAATKAAAEVKAEQMQIETTHIVRLKQDTPEPPDEHELFSSEAAEALAGKRTDKLIEEVVPPEEPKQIPRPEVASAAGQPQQTQQPAAATHAPTQNLVNAITRPSYAAPSTRRESAGSEMSGMRAFGVVLLMLFGISAGAYYVLVHQPNTINAQDEDLVFGEDLFSDVLEPPTLESPFDKLERDAFNNRTNNNAPKPDGPPIALDQQINLSPPQEYPADADSSDAQESKSGKLKLQSVVTTNKGRFAVINGKLYEQGKNIGSAKLVSVADDWVLIERDGQQFTLQIEPSASK